MAWQYEEDETDEVFFDTHKIDEAFEWIFSGLAWACLAVALLTFFKGA